MGLSAINQVQEKRLEIKPFESIEEIESQIDLINDITTEMGKKRLIYIMYKLSILESGYTFKLNIDNKMEGIFHGRISGDVWSVVDKLFDKVRAVAPDESYYFNGQNKLNQNLDKEDFYIGNILEGGNIGLGISTLLQCSDFDSYVSRKNGWAKVPLDQEAAKKIQDSASEYFKVEKSYAKK